MNGRDLIDMVEGLTFVTAPTVQNQLLRRENFLSLSEPNKCRYLQEDVRIPRQARLNHLSQRGNILIGAGKVPQ